MLALRLPEDVEQRLDALAQKTGRTKTFYATKAVVEYIQDIEDYYAAEQAFAEYMAGDRTTFSLDEVLREL